VRIVHALASAAEQSVDGCSNVVWTLARAQAALGHDVHLVVYGRSVPGVRAVCPAGPAPGGEPVAAAAGGPAPAGAVGLVAVTDLAALRALRRRADVLHLHSAFAPRLAWVQAVFGGVVPVVAAPHGGLAWPVLGRGRAKKLAWSVLVERRRLRATDLLLAVTAAEARDIGAYLGRRRPPVAVLPNPVRLEAGVPGAGRDRRRVVFLGRFDVLTKGLDRLVVAAGHSRAEFHLYGRPRPGGPPVASAGNVVMHPPVFGAAKAAVLAGAAAYVQPSRWEAFGMSLAEAALAGTPLIVAADCALAGDVVGHGCGIRVDFDDPPGAAAAIDALLGDDAARLDMGRRAADWAASFAPAAVAAESVRLYGSLRAVAP
jgi:glycosyltransferase involved in cell wall biosynthesis